ncbi:MAG: hypothetical protein K2O53_08775, partial [Bacteroidales bacterium]|nr:hypothetical protein [Bacteroidales bacterium]
LSPPSRLRATSSAPHESRRCLAVRFARLFYFSCASKKRWPALREGARRKFGAAERQEDFALGGRFTLHA